ncbi:VanZ family protein [Sedimentibacter sp.]|uniref:VanZ family protein n=1 Tax=Sedimentibacter sp. TaxID=1960295 RepID=UPI0028A89A10|nr:VanZ family protein [Sedimentibacter sp.]
MNNYIKYLTDIIALIIIYAVFLFKKWKSKGKDMLLVNTLLYVYIALVLYVTLMPVILSLPFIFDHAYIPMNMLAFDDYFSGRAYAAQQILLNVILMIPFGFIIPIVKKQNIFSCALLTFLFSLSIELVQPLINGFRSSDVTDLITNTIGGIIGYLLYLAFKPLINTLLNLLKTNQ